MILKLLPAFSAVLIPLSALINGASGEVIHPNRTFKAADVVTIQLEALMNNNLPQPDEGIRQTWAFAHPVNRSATGPVERFSNMIKGPHYRELLEHISHDIQPLESDDTVATFAVEIVSRSGRRLGFQWVVARVSEGKYAGAWMTIQVSPPVPLGQNI